MSKAFFLDVESLANRAGVDKAIVVEAVEAALASVTAKRYDEEVDIRVSINTESGDYDTFRRWTVVADEELEEPGKEIVLSKAQEIDSELEIGDVIEESVEPVEFGRIAARQAMQVITQRVKEAERDKVAKEYLERVGEILPGTVKKVTRDFLLIDLGGNVEGIMYREHMIPKENFRMGDTVLTFLYDVSSEKRGPQILLSRTHPEMLKALFAKEVPEISEEVIEIKAVARDPGSRAKIAVKTNDGRIDPIGACVGMRGSRVQAVSGELNNERIDIVLWNDNPAQLVMNALAPAEVASIVVDEDSHSMDIAVNAEQLSQAIGRNGQNVRLASELTSWNLNVMSVEEAEKKSGDEVGTLNKLFMDNLDVDEDVAAILIQEGFTSIEEVAYLPLEEMLEIEEFDQDLVEELQARARDALLTRELASHEALGDAQPAQDLLELEGMTTELAYRLASQNIVTREDLAENSVDDISGIEGMTKDLAAKLIMEARKPWFLESEESSK